MVVFKASKFVPDLACVHCSERYIREFLLQTKKALKQKASKQTNAHADQFKKIVQEKQHALLELLDNRAIVAYAPIPMVLCIGEQLI